MFISYYEYNDMFLKCQKKAPYKLYIYDVVNSKKLSDPLMTSNLQLLIFTLYMKIKELSNATKNKILHHSDLLNYTQLRSKEIDNQIYYYLEPTKPFQNQSLLEPFLVSGDCIGFSVNRGTISDDLVDYLFEETKKQLNINYEFHKAVGYYETDDWVEGNNKYYRGYAIQLLSYFHKEENKVLKKQTNYYK